MALFKDRFNALFDESGKKQEEFGNIFGITKDQVFNWRNGRGEPDSEMLKQLANFYDVSVDYLVGNSDDTISKEETPNHILAAHRVGGIDDLPEEAQKELDSYVEYLKSKYKK